MIVNSIFSNVIAQAVIASIFSGGLLASIVALLKLRPEASSAAVAAATGAMGTMIELNDRLRLELADTQKAVAAAKHAHQQEVDRLAALYNQERSAQEAKYDALSRHVAEQAAAIAKMRQELLAAGGDAASFD